MRIIYLPTNQRYALQFGDSLVSVGPYHKTLWESKLELVQALGYRTIKEWNERPQ